MSRSIEVCIRNGGLAWANHGQDQHSFLKRDRKLLSKTLGGTKKLEAFVVAGRGNASRDRLAETREISERFGISLIAGSLNLISKSPVWLDTAKAIHVNGGGTHFYWQGRLNGFPVILNRWSERCPAHVYEVFAEEHLRSKFGLADGDAVALEISAEIVDQEENASNLNRFVWFLTWWKREPLAYHNGAYAAFALRRSVRRLTRRAYQNCTCRPVTRGSTGWRRPR